MSSTSTLTIRGDADQRTIEQIERCMTASAVRGVLCADNHVGYSMPIGGAVAYADHISPSGVGYDIACGNRATKTNVRYEDIRDDISGIMDRVFDEISFGMGRKNNEPVDHPVLDGIRQALFAPQRQMLDLAAKQLGTVGSGNHYVDLFVDEEGWVWIGVHFGSRGFGYKTASGFLALAQGKRFTDNPGKESMDSPPVLFETRSDLGLSYIAAMSLAGDYAYAGRDLVVEKVLGILGAEDTYTVHNHHNFAWLEEHDGQEVWVVRKGCTPAFPGQAGFVGSTMAEDSVILEGTDSDEGLDLLRSTVHGAGRAMSRMQAAGKVRSRWSCNNRDCDWFQPPETHKPEDGKCPECGHPKLSKRPQQMAEGLIDFEKVKADMAAIEIELRGAGADEAPRAYKRLDQVLEAQGDSIRILHRLSPIGVAMAGADVQDLYPD